MKEDNELVIKQKLMLPKPLDLETQTMDGDINNSISMVEYTLMVNNGETRDMNMQDDFG